MQQLIKPVVALHSPPLGEGNHLIDRLFRQERQDVLARIHIVELAYGSVLCDADKPFDHAYFPPQWLYFPG